MPLLTPTPTDVFVVSVTPTSVTLGWIGDALDEEYSINYDVIAINGITLLTHEVTGLTPGTTYTFTIKALQDGVWSFPSNPISGTPSEAAAAGSGGVTTGTDELGSFLFITRYDVPAGTSGDVTVTYRRGKMATGLYGVDIIKVVDKQTLIDNFGLDPTFEGIRDFIPQEYGL